MKINQDVFFEILCQLHDFEDLRAVIRAIPLSHEFFPTILQRVGQLPVTVSSIRRNLHESKGVTVLETINKDARISQSLRILDIHLAPASVGEFGLPAHILKDTKQILATAAQELFEQLPAIFRTTINLQQLSWFNSPPPNAACLEALAGLDRLYALTIDCVIDDWFGRDPHIESFGNTLDIGSLFSTLGPKLTHINLRQVDEDIFNDIVLHCSSLVALRELTLDLTCGNWDWDGRGSPQIGPSDAFEFTQLPCASSIRRFALSATDITLRPSRGPLNLIEPRILQSLILRVENSLSWITLRSLKVFSGLQPSDFPALSHLEVHDVVWDVRPTRWDENDLQEREWHEEARFFIGLRDFIIGLPSLTSLWVDSKVLLDPVSDPGPNFGTEIAHFTAKETMRHASWARVADKLRGLRSLRVGLGALDAVGLELLLGDKAKLRQFGFDWDWRAHGREEPISPTLLQILRGLPLLRDVHLLYPHPDSTNDLDGPRALADVRAIFDACPQVCRVGAGRVWERAPGISPSGPTGPLPIARILEEAMPEFYKAGFSDPSNDRDSSSDSGDAGDAGGILEQLNALPLYE